MQGIPAATSVPVWHAECIRRLKHLWLFKSVGTAVFTSVFFYGYFAILKSPVFPVTIMPTSVVDDWIVFMPSAFYVYASLWIYTALMPALQPNLPRLVGYGCTIGLLCLTGLLFFYFLPTTVPFRSDDWLTAPTLSVLREIDLSGNACPSLHVATALFTGMCLHRLLRDLACPSWLKVGNWVWCGLIIYSTMAIKQHVMWDVVAGTALGLCFGWSYSLFERRLRDRH